MPDAPPPTADDVTALAREQGFALAGIAPAQPTAHRAALDDWLAANKHGEMHYLAENVDVRADPRQILPGAKAVICVADFHHVDPPDAGSEDRDEVRGRIARYAWGDDYHKVIKKRLFALADALRERWPAYAYRAAVDTAPVLEREHAARAGLGWVGKHTLLIHPTLGSYMMLGEIVTTMPVAVGEPAVENHCGTCTRCIDACPTDCITPWSVDASQCISYLTLEHRGSIDPSLHEPMGDWLAGCDVCQEVCPYNNADEGSPRAIAQRERPVRDDYAVRAPGPHVSLIEVLSWTVDDRQRVLTKSALKRIKLDMWHRNALIAAGNVLAMRDDADLRAAVERWADDDAAPDMVRDTARTVLRRLSNSSD